jgi:hypothetical protein
MKLSKTYTVQWNVKNINSNTFFAGVYKEFHSLKDAIDFIESGKQLEDSIYPIQVNTEDWDVEIEYVCTKEDENSRECSTKTQSWKKWKEELEAAHK